MQTQAIVGLDQNGNRTELYQDDIREYTSRTTPETFIELGVGVGNSLLAAYDGYTRGSYLGIDLFGRAGSVNQLEEFQSNLRASGAHLHVLKAPATFAAPAYDTNQIEVIHIDIFDNPNLTNAPHTLRSIFTAWAPKARTIIVPREALYLDTLSDITLHEQQPEHLIILETSCLK